MWNGDLWVLYVSSYEECGLVGPVVCSYEEYVPVGPVCVPMWNVDLWVLICGMWTCGSSVCAVWGGNLWVL